MNWIIDSEWENVTEKIIPCDNCSEVINPGEKLYDIFDEDGIHEIVCQICVNAKTLD